MLSRVCQIGLVWRRQIHSSVWRLSNVSSLTPLSKYQQLTNHDEKQTGRLVDGESIQQKYEEQAIIEKLCKLSPKGEEVPQSEFKYREMADNAWCNRLPTVPKGDSIRKVQKYIEKLTTLRYPQDVSRHIPEILLKIIRSSPEMFQKKDYLSVVQSMHFLSEDMMSFEVIDTMMEKTELRQDIDFDNALLAQSLRPANYFHLLKRLERMEECGSKPNNNTWYTLFRTFKTPQPKVQMVGLMKERGIPLFPIWQSIAYNMAIGGATPEEMMQFYKEEKIRWIPFTFNKLLTAYLTNDRVQEAWELLLKQPKGIVNSGPLASFVRYFGANNQLYNCIAFTELFKRMYGLPETYSTFANVMLKDVLLSCQFFDNWFGLVQSTTSLLNNEAARHRDLVSPHTIRQLKSYSWVHGRKNFDPMTLDKDSLILKERLMADLKWSKKPDAMPVPLEKTSPEFQSAANLIAAPYAQRPSKTEPKVFDPSELI